MRLFTTAALLLCATPTSADVLEPALVDARARVLVHVDVAALTRTRLFDLLADDPDVDVADALSEFEEEIGLDPLHDVRSLTVYSNDVEKEHWVALLRTNENLDAAVARLEGRRGYVQTRTGDKTIHSLHEDGQEWHGHMYRSEQGGERLFVITESIEVLVEAIRVVDGERQNLLRAEEPGVQHAPSPGAVLFVSADRGLGDLGDFATSEVSRLVRGVLFECGESEGTLFANLRLTAATEKDAKDIHDVIQGGLAMASLIAGREDETRVIDDLVDALDVRREGTAVIFAFRYSSQALYDGLVGLRDLTEREYR